MANYRVYYNFSKTDETVTQHHTEIEVVEADEELVRSRFVENLDTILGSDKVFFVAIEIVRIVPLD